MNKFSNKINIFTLKGKNNIYEISNVHDVLIYLLIEIPNEKVYRFIKLLYIDGVKYIELVKAFKSWDFISQDLLIKKMNQFNKQKYIYYLD